MANKGAKKRKDENESRVKFLRNIIIVSNVVYILLKFALQRLSIGWMHAAGFIFTSLVYKFCYDQIAVMAKASYDESGELIDGGYDFKQGGLIAYIEDILYVTAFVQVSSVISDKFWFLFAVVPLYAFYMLWVNLIYPYFFQRPQEQPETEDEKAKKKREKLERKQARSAMLRSKFR